MINELEKERTRKRIGSAVVDCHDCGGPLSFRDATPFCRSCDTFNQRRPEVRRALVREQKQQDEIFDCLNGRR